MIRAKLLPLIGMLVLAALPVAAAPAFGPKTYERTNGASDVYNDTFTAPAAATAYLWIENGDDGGDRTSSATIVLNGTTVAGPTDFSQKVDTFARQVALVSGSNTLQVTMDGEAGSYITLAILPPGEMPDHVTGRLLLPYGDGSNLTLAFKSGARFERRIRLIFYDAGGNVVAKSDKLAIPPHGALSKAALDFITSGTWTEGSIEIVYAGQGAGRLFGLAATKDALTGFTGVVPLEHAGYRHTDILEPAPRSPLVRR